MEGLKLRELDNSIVEEIFSSRGRVRTLRALIKLEEANISRIVRETGMHHKLVESHLEKLEELGIVLEKKYSRVRLFKLNYTNPKTHLIKELIQLLED